MRLATLLAVGVVLVAACGDEDAKKGGPGGGTGSGGPGDPAGSSGGIAGPGTSYAGCRIFPNDNPWNTDISSAAVDTELMAKISPAMNLTRGLHPDWGTVRDEFGIPITVGNAAAPVPISWNTSYGPRESDKLACPTGGGEFCYPIPLDAKIEGGPNVDTGTDRHVLFLAKDGAPDHCVLYELYNAQNPKNGWTAASGAIWKLDSNALRKEGDTSADAAGLSVMAGLVRREEIERGEITHALRFTMSKSQNAYIHPATHAAGKTDGSLPPMGLRVRLRASFVESSVTGPAQIIMKAMKKYGLILADNGSDWYISGETHEAWQMEDLNKQLGKIKGSDFEIVKTGEIIPQPE